MCLSCFPARAGNWSRDFFAVSGIAASASAGSPSEAKRQALVGARERAFFIVLGRVLHSKDVERAVIPDAYNMDKFIEKYKLGSEKTGHASYSASVDVRINRALMEDYLKGQGLKCVPDASPPALVVPVIGGEVEAGWLEAFAAAALSLEDNPGNTNIVPIVLPSANHPSDFSRAGIERMRTSPLSDMQYVMSKAGASTIIMAEFLEGTGGACAVAITDRRAGEVLRIPAGCADLKEAALGAIAALNDIYKAGYAADGSGNSTFAVVPIRDLSGWIKIEAALAKIPEVKELSVRALKYDKAQLAIKYSHGLDALVTALRSAGFMVESKDGYIVIRK